MKGLYKTSFLSSFGTLVYIVIVAIIMQNGERIFGNMDNFFGPIAFLLLFTLSALIVGSLILGKPIMFYLNGSKKESVSLLLANIGWMAVFTIIALIIELIIK